MTKFYLWSKSCGTKRTPSARRKSKWDFAWTSQTVQMK